MDNEEEFTPKDLEVLPFKIVHDIAQHGITFDSSLYQETNGDLPTSVSKNFKKYSPKNRRFKKEAICSLNRVASLFVLYITTISKNIAKNNKRSTVFDKDILEALRQCMFWEVESQVVEDLERLDSDLPNLEDSEKPENITDDLEIDEEDIEMKGGMEYEDDQEVDQIEDFKDDIVDVDPEGTEGDNV